MYLFLSASVRPSEDFPCLRPGATLASLQHTTPWCLMAPFVPLEKARWTVPQANSAGLHLQLSVSTQTLPAYLLQAIPFDSLEYSLVPKEGFLGSVNSLNLISHYPGDICKQQAQCCDTIFSSLILNGSFWYFGFRTSYYLPWNKSSKKYLGSSFTIQVK